MKKLETIEEMLGGFADEIRAEKQTIEEPPVEETAEAAAAEPVEESIAEPIDEEPKPPREKFKLPTINLPVPLKSILALFLIAAISAAVLGGVNALTAERIERQRRLATERAVGAVMPGIGELKQINDTLYSEDTGEYTVYAALVAPMGYGGELPMVVGVSDRGVVTGISIVSSLETPGIGTKALDTAFLEQFLGKTAGVAIGHGDNSVDAISGATITSKAVTAGVAGAVAAVAAYIVESGEAENG
ncbi:hypothetical protein FACS1894217_09150 [Clostridia bacterium]|nr:hypothetical protein FACS1894217_09150 [Clostridia bacterium]